MVSNMAPVTRRGSMTETQQRERRASIKAIMVDQSLTPHERRRSIQFLMDGRRNSASFNQPTTPESSSNFEASRRMEESRPVCTHYDRKCSIISPCCGATFGCRICHDECPVLPQPKYGACSANNDDSSPDSQKSVSNSKTTVKGKMKYSRCSSMPMSFSEMPEPEHHNIDRFAIREVICRECFTRQSSKTNECIKCYAQFGEYHCAECNLWMSEEASPYHCADCGFCRVGGRENFRHCFDCGMCIDVTLFDEHNCKVGKYMSNCPVCQEDLFSSRSASHEMPCGHAIHWHCFQELASFDSRCPVCKKTAESAEKMASTWNSISMGIQMQPLPQEMTKVVNITCNDCEERSYGSKWHFLGVQCKNCNSFNTNVDEILMTGVEAADFLTAIEAQSTCVSARNVYGDAMYD